MFKTTIITQKNVELELFAIPGSKAKAFRVTHSVTVTRGKKNEASQSSQQQGIALTTKEIASLRAGYFGPNHPIIILNDDSMAMLRDFGYSDFARNYPKDWFDETNFYDYFVGGGDPDKLVRFESADHSFWDINGKVVASGVHFDYIQARMTDRVYNIQKAANILAARDDVRLLRAVGFGEHDLSLAERVTKDAKTAIQRIPYYNSDSGSTCLEFFWSPTQEQAELLQNNRRDRFKLIFENDWLGLRARGAAKYGDYYSSDERDYDEDDCHC